MRLRRSSGRPLVSKPSAPEGIDLGFHRAASNADVSRMEGARKLLMTAKTWVSIVNKSTRFALGRAETGCARHRAAHASAPARIRSRWRRATDGSMAFTPIPSRSRARPPSTNRAAPRDLLRIPGSSRWRLPTTSSSLTSTAPSRRSTLGSPGDKCDSCTGTCASEPNASSRVSPPSSSGEKSRVRSTRWTGASDTSRTSTNS